MQNKQRPTDSGFPAQKQAVPQLGEILAILIPGTGFRILQPSKSEEELLSKQFDVPTKIALTRKRAMQGIAGREIFAQQSFTVGRSEDGSLVVIVISLLTTRTSWRGGWGIFLVLPDETELFQKHLRTARNEIAANLRRERSSGGSFS